eukprot:gene4859-5009_t
MFAPNHQSEDPAIWFVGANIASDECQMQPYYSPDKCSGAIAGDGSNR